MAESKSQEQELLKRRIPSVKRLDSVRLDSIQMPSFLLSRDRSVRRTSKVRTWLFGRAQTTS